MVAELPETIQSKKVKTHAVKLAPDRRVFDGSHHLSFGDFVQATCHLRLELFVIIVEFLEINRIFVMGDEPVDLIFAGMRIARSDKFVTSVRHPIPGKVARVADCRWRIWLSRAVSSLGLRNPKIPKPFAKLIGPVT